MNQSIEKEYVEKFKRENVGKKVLEVAIAICYDSKSKSYRIVNIMKGRLTAYTSYMYEYAI